jgi:DNA-binding response OmpR family regulator
MIHRILIVDDQEAILFAMREYFAALSYLVDCAREPEEAYALLAENSYSLVVADLRLTGSCDVEGLEIVKAVREKSPSTRIIMLTAYGSLEIEDEAKRSGVDVFLHKPRPLPEVAALAVRLLERPA